MKHESLQFVDLSGETAGERDSKSNKQLDSIVSLTHDVLLIVAGILTEERQNEETVAKLNKKVSDLLLEYNASKPAVVLTEAENVSVNAISTRTQPGLNELFVYGTSLYVSMQARLRTDYYKFFLANPDLYKKNFLNEYYELLEKFAESNDFSVLLNLQALSKSFLDQGLYRYDDEMAEIGRFARKIYGFCSMNMINIIESGGLRHPGIEEILQSLKVMRDQFNARVSSDN